MTETDRTTERRWVINDIAAFLGIKPSTLRAYITRGDFPPPDGREPLSGKPYWNNSTVINYRRPGRGHTRDGGPRQPRRTVAAGAAQGHSRPARGGSGMAAPSR